MSRQKVTINPAPAQEAGETTPTKQIIKQALNEVTVTDSKGRVIRLRKPGVLTQYRVVEMLGDHAATNRAYMGMVAPLTYIQTIDDDEVAINTKRELEALIVRLGEEGVEAVQTKVTEVWGELPDVDDQADKIKK